MAPSKPFKWTKALTLWGSNKLISATRMQGLGRSSLWEMSTRGVWWTATRIWRARSDRMRGDRLLSHSSKSRKIEGWWQLSNCLRHLRRIMALQRTRVHSWWLRVTCLTSRAHGWWASKETNLSSRLVHLMTTESLWIRHCVTQITARKSQGWPTDFQIRPIRDRGI